MIKKIILSLTVILLSLNLSAHPLFGRMIPQKIVVNFGMGRADYYSSSERLISYEDGARVYRNDGTSLGYEIDDKESSSESFGIGHYYDKNDNHIGYVVTSLGTELPSIVFYNSAGGLVAEYVLNDMTETALVFTLSGRK